MHKIEKKQWIGLILFALIAVLSMTAVANVTGSAKSKFSKACIKELDEQKNDAEILAASSLGLSVAVGLIPGDASSGISNKLADISGYLLIVLCAIFLEKYTLTIFGLLAFRILIPLGCLFIIISLFKPGKIRQIGIKIIVCAFILYLIVPTSLFVSAKIKDVYHESYEAVIEEADDSKKEIEKTNNDDSEKWLTKAKNKLAEVVSVLSSKAKDFLKKAQNTLNRMLEYVAVMIVTSCLIPFLVLFVYVYLSKAVLGVTFNDMLWSSISVEKLSKMLEEEKYERKN